MIGRAGPVALLALMWTGGLGAQQPASPHGALPQGLDCAACHTVQGWKPARSPMAFRHGSVSGFQLTGAHVTADCRGCHLDLRFDQPEVTRSDCVSCHLDVHEGRMVEGCVSCHTTVAFTPVDGDRVHARTSFPLTGAHLQLTCETCHTDDRGGAFSALPETCVSCHQQDYRSARSVNHVTAGFPMDCASCHATVAWADTPAFDHVSLSRGFQLVGAHATAACTDCHTVPGFTLLFPRPAGQNDCVACHQREYDARHASSAFPTTCQSCHTVETWTGATFDHVSASRGFELLGAHASATCAGCHTTPGYALRFPRPAGQNDCVACHRPQYDQRHGGSGYPTTCLNCHAVTSWASSAFNHDGQFFRINSGAHRGKWSSCATCHTVPSSFAVFTCLSCHEHRQTEMDPKHRQVSGYAYDSSRCYSCHRNSQ